MRKRWLKLAAVPVALAFVAASCSTEDDGGEVRQLDHRGRIRLRGHRGQPRHRVRREHRGRVREHRSRVRDDRSRVRDDRSRVREHRSSGRWRRRRRRRPRRHRGHRVRPGELGRRGRRHAGRAQRVRRGERHDDHVRRRPRLRGADQRPGRGRQPARHRHLPAARQARATSPRPATCSRCPTTSWPTSSENWDENWLRSATSTARSTASRTSPTSSRSSGTARPRSPSRATRCPTTLDEFFALTDQMIADGDTPLCVGIESGSGHRLAVHRLDRGDDAAQRGHRLLQPVGRPRGAVQRPARRRGHADQVADLWATGRRGVRRRWHRSRPRRSGTTPSRSRRPVHDAPPGELLRLLLPRGHEVRRRRGASRHLLLPVERAGRAGPRRRHDARRRSATLPRCGR